MRGSNPFHNHKFTHNNNTKQVIAAFDMGKQSKEVDPWCQPEAKIYARSALILPKIINAKTFGSETDTVLLTGEVNRVETNRLANGCTL